MEGKEVAWPATYAPIRVFILEVKLGLGVYVAAEFVWEILGFLTPKDATHI